MPRISGGVYVSPVGTHGIPNTTVASAPYNTNVDDVALDLNTPRPIVAGGTGATTAAAAMTNLGGELASQIVTNYDTFPFKPGSFYSAVGATNAPTAGHAFAGVAYGPDAATLVIEARDLNDTFQPGHLYVRERDSGVWGPWLNFDQRSLDAAAACVLKAGDVMTGGLFLNADPAAPLHATTKQYTDAAIATVTALANGKVAKAGDTMTGGLILVGDPSVPLHATTKQYTDAAIATVTTLANGKVAKAGDTMTGPLTIQNTLTLAQSGGPTAQMYFGNSGTSYLYFDGTNWGLNGGGGLQLSSLGVGTPTGGTPGLGNTLAGVSISNAPTLYCSRAATGSAVFNINTDGANVYYCRSGNIVGSVNVNTTSTTYATSSDERQKTDLRSLDPGPVIDGTIVYDFAWKNDPSQRAVGVIAQQAVTVFADAVVYDKEHDWYGVDYSKYVPLLLEEVKLLRARVAALEGSR